MSIEGSRLDVPLEDLTDEMVPLLLTDVPGPQSRALWDHDAVFHAHNSSPAAQFSRLVLRDGRGAVVRDVDGNVFIDFSSGAVVANLGHSPRAVVDALQREVAQLIHYFDFATPASGLPDVLDRQRGGRGGHPVGQVLHQAV